MLHDFSRALEMHDRIETDYLRILYYDFADCYDGVYHTYEYSRMCTILSGKKTVSVGGRPSFDYGNSDFMLLPPMSEVNMQINTRTKALVFELNEDLVKKVSGRVGAEYCMSGRELASDWLLHTRLSPELRDVLDKITGTITSKEKNPEYLIDLFAQEMVYYLTKVKGTERILSEETDNPVGNALKMIRKEYMTPLSVAELAGCVHMSESNFCQYFKRALGVTPKEYITNLKLARSRELLLHTSVTDVAMDLGYDNISHFIALFKCRYGITPKQYQKMCAGK